jgi:uncharacterized membrane protein
MSADLNRPPGERRRIVIPLEPEGQPGRAAPRAPRSILQPPPPRKSRLGRILAIFAVIIILGAIGAVAGAFFGWQRYKTTPTYALAVLVDGVQRNDMTTVDKVLNTDQIINSLAGQAVDQATQGYTPALAATARKQIEAMLPRVIPLVKQNVHDAMTERVKQISERANQKPFVVIALGLPFVARVSTENDVARAAAQVQDQQVELDMQRGPDGWMVVGVHDEALTRKIVDQVVKNLSIGPLPTPAANSRRPRQGA